MATNKELKKALLDKLKVSPQALSQRVQKKKDVSPMSTEDATYLIAHENGIRIDRYLAAETVDRVRQLHVHASTKNPDSQLKQRSTQARVRKDNRSIQVRFPTGLSTSDALLPKSKLNEAIAMAKIYPLLYVLENSIRELIKRVMVAEHGEDWWDTQLTKGKLKGVRQTAANRMKSEDEKYSWHQRRGDHPIDYVDIKDLETIILAKQTHFVPNLIPDLDWFKQFMKELYPSRNVVAHMNPLDGDNVKDIELRTKRWANMIDKVKAKIP